MVSLSTSAQTLQKFNNGFRLLATIVLLALLALALAKLVWMVFLPPAKLVLPSYVTKATAAAPVQKNYAQDLVNKHLFGVVSKAEPVKQAVIDAPNTTLNLKLKGVFAVGEDDDDEAGLALIADGSKPEQVFSVGDTVVSGTTLKTVYADRVILQRAGGPETLRLPEINSTGLSYASNEQPSGPKNNFSQPQRFEPPAPEGIILEDEVPPDVLGEISPQEMRMRREEFVRNPAKLAEIVQVEEVTENGEFQGFRVNNRRPDPLFDQLGLQSGDIVTAVNGIDIDSPSTGLTKVLPQIMRSDQLEVTIIRNGQEITLEQNF